MSKILLNIIKIYQGCISPLLPRSCRFQPSCSHYVYSAILGHGLLQGSLLGAKRILRCHPFNPGSYDPVPESYRDTGATNRPEFVP